MVEFAWEDGRFDETCLTLSQFLTSPINPTDVRVEYQAISGYYARLAAIQGEAEEAIGRISIEIARTREEFGESLAAKGTTRITDAYLKRKFEASEIGLRLEGAKASLKGREKRLSTLEKALRARHEAVISLTQRQIAELKTSKM